jgi:multidrug efflux pump subunit AcrA (membrane-fusion protein)
MGAVMKFLKRLKPWQVVGLSGLAAIVIIGSYGASTLSSRGGAQQPPPTEESQQVAVEQQPVNGEIPVNGHLVFSNRAELTFDTSGEVGEILVQEGKQVEEGQVLARLDSLTITALEESLAQAQFDLDQAQDGLTRARKAEFTGAPLVQAQFEEEVAKARKALTDAEERLRDFHRNQQQELAAAMKARADAELALDNARRDLGHYDRDQVQELATAQDSVATAELALDAAINALANFDEDYRESLANTRLKVGQAEEVLDAAEATLSEFYVGLGRTTPFIDRNDDGEHEAVQELTRLQTAVEEARTNLEQFQRELTRLEGNRSLLLQEKQTAVETARANLKEAQDTVARVEEETDQLLELRARQAAVEAAQANLEQAEIDLQEELEGPDQTELAVREKEVAMAQERLSDLINPDPLDVSLQEARVSRAQARMDDALEELEGAIVRAPFDGVVSLLNIEIDDIVDDESRVIELVAPGSVAVEGLIDATNIQFVKGGSKAKVTIASVPGQEFEGTVIQVAKEPKTERGVLSYPVRIQVDVPPGVEVPVSLSQVTSVVMYEG